MAELRKATIRLRWSQDVGRDTNLGRFKLSSTLAFSSPVFFRVWWGGIRSLASELLPAAAALLTTSNLLLSPALLLPAAAESSALTVALSLVGAEGLFDSSISSVGGSVVVSGGSWGSLFLLVVSWSWGWGWGWGRGSSLACRSWGRDRGTVGSRGIVSSTSGFSLSSNLLIQGVEALGFGAVKVEPPVADEVVLVEDGAVGAEEGVLGKTTLAVSGADVEDLTLSLGISIVAWNSTDYFRSLVVG